MRSSDDQGSSSKPFRSFGLSIFRKMREKVRSTEGIHESGNADVELFQKQVTERFHELSIVSAEGLLSVEWIKNLLDVFMSCQEEFRVILLKNRDQVLKSPLDKMISDFFESSLKALDICNVTRDGIENLRSWQKQLEIVQCALHSPQRVVGESHFRRARKALGDLELAMLELKQSVSVSSQRNRSFGRHGSSSSSSRGRSSSHPSGHSRSLSWSVSQSWSAAKQLKSMSSNLVTPRAKEVMATNGLAVLVFTMKSVLLIVLWTLVAAIPCPDRGLNIHFHIPENFSWAAPMLQIYERIMEESKKRERRNSNGLLKEIYQYERCTRRLIDLIDVARFPLTEEQKTEVEQGVQELDMVCEIYQNSLEPLQRQVREEVFSKIVSCRNEGLAILARMKIVLILVSNNKRFCRVERVRKSSRLQVSRQAKNLQKLTPITGESHIQNKKKNHAERWEQIWGLEADRARKDMLTDHNVTGYR
ncbi:uncharacterized protein LOC120003534 [Tripterygium wilfordii]|uniref:uncharacterized protein LOC120003533 n=1 Tax=Tripterygium wilfordii TaxID=458696 RepID=UPI0018F7FE77|nr:uncharacterized protein LOC120003533 [Tripterygium wilfordii]XP_038708478.1 uncharacterized protein LOC120003534 [Tripterygium wilfordii]